MKDSSVSKLIGLVNRRITDINDSDNLTVIEKLNQVKEWDSVKEELFKILPTLPIAAIITYSSYHYL
jgi:hypothetical protein